MPQMTPDQARVIDPILSNHARAYSNDELVFHHLFPRVSIPLRGARIMRFGKEAFRLLSGRRAPGANTRRVQYGYASDPVSVLQEALEAVLPFEIMDEASLPGVDMAGSSINMTMGSMMLAMEYECSQIALDAGTYDDNHKVALTGTDKWSDAGKSNPVGDIKGARESVRRSIGRYPNTLVLGPDVFNVLTEHPLIVAKLKYNSDQSVTTDVLARIFELDSVVVGKAVYLPEDAAEADLATDIWGGSVILAWVPPSGQDFLSPSYGYTYELPGMPMVEEPYYDKSAKSYIYPVTYERRPYVVGADAGFIIQTAI